MDLWQAVVALGSSASWIFPLVGLVAPPSQLRMIRKHGLKLRKRLGQHILIDGNIARKIVDILDPTDSEGVVEIGAGLGALTHLLRTRAGYTVAVEIDRRLSRILREELGNRNLEVLEANFLKIDLAELTRDKKGIEEWKIVGNLPYCITTAIILKLVESRCSFTEAVLTVQEEYARRLIACPGMEDYSSLSIFVQYRFKPEMLFVIKPSSFFPQPDVRSAVVRLKVLNRPRVLVSDEGLFFQTIRAAFGQRRKTLKNSLRKISGLTPEMVGELGRISGVDLGQRAEDLSIEEFATLTNTMARLLG
ncbi:MAG: 16S rRNA (adenine(1518)-N(6)/adenine(1519)-N(6))-dimethyltransferase RsmA [bacterium]